MAIYDLKVNGETIRIDTSTFTIPYTEYMGNDKLKLGDAIYCISDFCSYENEHQMSPKKIRTKCSCCGASLQLNYNSQQLGWVRCLWCRSIENVYEE